MGNEYSERKKLHPLRYVLIGMLLGLIKILLFDRSEPATQSILSPVTSESMYATPVSSIIILVISGMIILGCFIYLFYSSRDEYVSMHDTAPVTLAFIPIFASVAAIFAVAQISRIDDLSLMRECEFKSANGYAIYIDGERVENPKLDLNYYHISFDDAKKEAFLTRKEK